MVGILMSAAAPALAHARLIATTPAGGATVQQAPDEVTLEFSERIETGFGGVQVFDPAGERVDAGQAQIAGTLVRMPLEDVEQAGTYTVVFRIISGDGHPVESRFSFDYQPPRAPTAAPTPTVTEPQPGEATAVPTEPGATAGPTPAGTPSPAGTAEAVAPAELDLEDAGPGTATGLWTARLVNYLAVTAVIGLLLAAAVLLASGDGLSASQRRAAHLAGMAAVAWAVSAAAMFVLGLSTAAARPLPEAVSGDLPARFAATRFGGTVLLQAVLALAVGMLALAARSRRGLLPAGLVAAVAAFAPAWWGHAGTAPLPAVALASDWAHVLATAAWVGGLGALALFILPRALPGSPAGSGEDPGPSSAAGPPGGGMHQEILTPARRFSGIASIALAVVLVTGTINTLLHVDAVDQLWTTFWGRLVLTKLSMFAGIALLAWRNRTRLLPRMATGRAPAKTAFRTMALAELGLMVITFGAATALASSIPADAEAAARIQSVVTAFGDGQINLTVDPATVGDNVVHLYFLDDSGRQREVEDPSLTLTGPGEPLELGLLPAGPGHYIVLNQPIDTAGAYQVTVTATVDGQTPQATGQVTIR